MCVSGTGRDTTATLIARCTRPPATGPGTLGDARSRSRSWKNVSGCRTDRASGFKCSLVLHHYREAERTGRQFPSPRSPAQVGLLGPWLGPSPPSLLGEKGTVPQLQRLASGGVNHQPRLSLPRFSNRNGFAAFSAGLERNTWVILLFLVQRC